MLVESSSPFLLANIKIYKFLINNIKIVNPILYICIYIKFFIHFYFQCNIIILNFFYSPSYSFFLHNSFCIHLIHFFFFFILSSLFFTFVGSIKSTLQHIRLLIKKISFVQYKSNFAISKLSICFFKEILQYLYKVRIDLCFYPILNSFQCVFTGKMFLFLINLGLCTTWNEFYIIIVPYCRFTWFCFFFVILFQIVFRRKRNLKPKFID